MRIAILGCGLIGTSTAMASVRAGHSVVGNDSDAQRLAEAARRGGFEAEESVANAVHGSDVAVVCTPTFAIPGIVREALSADPHVVVTDAGSVKGRVVGEIVSGLDPGALQRFVGGHPMTGSERSGPAFASASLMEGAVWVLTPTETSDPNAVTTVEAWVTSIGAKPLRMDPRKHDEAVAIVSHLPQIASTALMTTAAEHEEPDTLMLAAGGFRDLTRLAASKPDLWAGILSANSTELAVAIDTYIETLERFRAAVVANDVPALESALREGTDARLGLTAKPQVRAGVAIVQAFVPDRPGALAQLTAALGARDVNIEDLQIVHGPEGGRGRAHITVATHDADVAVEALSADGFEADRLA
jgi:prephenate dehydrogenase